MMIFSECAAQAYLYKADSGKMNYSPLKVYNQQGGIS